MIKIGDIIDNRYSVLSHLGTGGMAVVFSCRDLYTNKVVALKILKEELLTNESIVNDFAKEVKSSIAMVHENIMEIYQDGVWNNRPYLVSEYLKGKNLADKIDYYGKFSVQEACQIMIQLLKAIKCIHDHDLIHRDIKPQNIFYLPNGIIKLGDFGIAANKNDIGNEEEIMGSIHYLAPEVLKGRPFSIASDIYATGITFFQLITGVFPFDGTTSQIASDHVKKEFPKPSNFISDIPKDLEYIILKSVDKLPNSRFRSADDFIEAIENFQAGKKIKKPFLQRFI